MPLNLADYEVRTKEAIQFFWGSRATAAIRQVESGKADQGERAGVTGGKNMDGFIVLVKDLVAANGLSDATVEIGQSLLTLPGYFRPTKSWDVLVMRRKRLIAALEFKSQVGPSFGNNFNNRSEEAIGTAHDLWTAYRENAFGPDQPRPFVGWLMLLEDCAKSRRQVACKSPHFPVFPEFISASYAGRYNLLCQKLIQEQLYTAATIVVSPRSAADDGAYTNLAETTSLKQLVASLAAHLASEAAMRP